MQAEYARDTGGVNAAREILSGYLSQKCPDDEYYDAKKEHKNRNLIDPVHHAQVKRAFLLFKQVGRIEVVQNFL